MSIVVDLELVKQHGKIEVDDDDTLIEMYIDGAVAHVERVTGLVLDPDDARVETFDSFSPALRLRSWPVREIVSVAYVDPAGADLALADGDWRLAAGQRPARLSPTVGACWPRTLRDPAALSVTLKAGYDLPIDVPASIRTAILLLVLHWYRNRAAVEAGMQAAAVSVPLGFDDLIAPWRMPSL